jgi:hypothetical protein
MCKSAFTHINSTIQKKSTGIAILLDKLHTNLIAITLQITQCVNHVLTITRSMVKQNGTTIKSMCVTMIDQINVKLPVFQPHS